MYLFLLSAEKKTNAITVYPHSGSSSQLLICKRASSDDTERVIGLRVCLQDRAETSGIRAGEHVEGGEMLECGWVTSSSEALGVGGCLGQLCLAPC